MYVDEIWVQLAENLPQKQVQERLREYIIIKMEDFIMAKRGGFPGGMPGNMNNLMKQAQMLQKQMAEMQEEISNTVFEGNANGDLVVAQVNGKKELLSLKIKPEIVDPDDVEMLEDLVITAVRMALSKAEQETSEKMGKLTGGMNMPGLF